LLYSIGNKTYNEQRNLWFNIRKKYNFSKVYENFKEDRFNIIKEHRYNKSGIYLLFNKINSRYYIGSSSNIAGRMRNYLNKSYLSNRRNKNMPINNALLKYEHNNFALIIIEYLPINDLLVRETYWINSLTPYYNILKFGYSSKGFKHKETTKIMLKIKSRGRVHSDKTKVLISESLKGSNNPFFMRRHLLKSKELISINRSKRLIYLYDSFLKLQVIFTSLTFLAKTINSNNKTLQNYLNENKLFRGNWYIKESLLCENDLPYIIDKSSEVYKNLIKEIIKNSYIKQAIFVFNAETKEFMYKFDGIMLAEKFLNIRHEKIKQSILNNKSIDNYIFNYHRILHLSDNM